MNWWSVLHGAIQIGADLATIAASGIAVWLFVKKGPEIGDFLKVIKNFVHQNSVAEMRIKLEQLASLHASNADNTTEISSLFLDICGQIDGNPYLSSKLSELCSRMRLANTGKRPIKEPYKRALVSELRESLRHLDVASFAETIGEKK